MQAYDDIDAGMPAGPDAFDRSRTAFNALAATLGGADAAGWTHDQLEEHLSDRCGGWHLTPHPEVPSSGNNLRGQYT